MATTFQNQDETMRQMLLNNPTIALVGASPKPVRPSNSVMAFLLRSGYKVIPINPGQAGKEMHGQTAYASLSDMPQDDIVGGSMKVDIFLNPASVEPIIEQAVQIEAVKSVWFQIDVVNEAAAQQAQEAGLGITAESRCGVGRGSI